MMSIEEIKQMSMKERIDAARTFIDLIMMGGTASTQSLLEASMMLETVSLELRDSP